MAIATSTALLIAAAAGTGYSIYSGERGRAQQKQALTRQQQMQREAETRAARQQQLGDEAVRSQQARQPTISSMLGGGAPMGGMLTALPDPQQPQRKTLLGG